MALTGRYTSEAIFKVINSANGTAYVAETRAYFLHLQF